MDAGGRQRSRPHDALRDGGLGDEVRARDFGGRQAADESKRERHPGFGRQQRMTRDEDKAQQVVADVVVQRVHGRVESRRAGFVLAGFELTSDFLVLAVEHLPAPKQVDGAMFGRRHEPGAGVVGNTRLGPLLERDDERVLREILGDTHVAYDPGKTGNQPRGFDAPDCVDGAMRVGSRHGYRSHHLQWARASPRLMSRRTP